MPSVVAYVPPAPIAGRSISSSSVSTIACHSFAEVPSAVAEAECA